jgi:hypothetical protein
MKHSLDTYLLRVGALSYIPTAQKRAYMKKQWPNIIKEEITDVSIVDLGNYYCAQLDFIEAAINSKMPNI